MWNLSEKVKASALYVVQRIAKKMKLKPEKANTETHTLSPVVQN